MALLASLVTYSMSPAVDGFSGLLLTTVPGLVQVFLLLLVPFETETAF